MEYEQKPTPNTSIKTSHATSRRAPRAETCTSRRPCESVSANGNKNCRYGYPNAAEKITFNRHQHERKTSPKTSTTTCSDKASTNCACIKTFRSPTRWRQTRAFFGRINGTSERQDARAKFCQRRENNSGYKNCRHSPANSTKKITSQSYEQGKEIRCQKTGLQLAIARKIQWRNQGKACGYFFQRQTTVPKCSGERHI